MPVAIRQFPTTERIRQIYFLQLLNRIKGSDLQLDTDAIEAKFPGFLHKQDFTGISVDELFKFITYEERMGRESIYHLHLDYALFPDHLYAFCDVNFSAENTDFNHFPYLYDRYIEAEKSDLVAMYSFRSLYLYHNQGEQLNVVLHPNLYDNGNVDVHFLTRTFFAIVSEDDNNGQSISLYEFKNGRLEHSVASTKEQLELMESKRLEWGFDHLSDAFKDDRDVVLWAYTRTNFKRKDLFFVSERLRDDDDVADAAVEAWSGNYSALSDRLKRKESLALLYIKNWPIGFESLPNPLKRDKNFVLAAVASKAEVIDYLPEMFQTDPEIISKAVQAYPGAYAYYLPLAPPELLNDKGKVKEIVSKYPKALLHLNNDLRNDEDVLSAALKKDASMVTSSSEVQTNRNLALKMAIINGEVIRYLHKHRNDVNFALDCVNKSGLYLQYFPDTIRSNKQVILAACEQNKDAIWFAADATDKEISELFRNAEKQKKAEEDDLPF